MLIIIYDSAEIGEVPRYFIHCFALRIIDHFTVVCSVTWPLSRSEAGGDLVLIQTPLSFSCKCGLVSITTT